MTCETEVRRKSSKDNECTCRYASNERMRRGEESGSERMPASHALQHCTTTLQLIAQTLFLTFDR